MHNYYPSSKHDNKYFTVIYRHVRALLSPEGRCYLGRSTKWPRLLKCFSLHHICPRWSPIAHWRMHEIKCLLETTMYYPSLRLSICIHHHHVEQNDFSPIRPNMSLVYVLRDYFYVMGTCCTFTVLLRITLSAPCCAVRRAQSGWRGLDKGRSVAVLPSSSICLLGWICVEYFSHIKQFLYSFIK